MKKEELSNNLMVQKSHPLFDLWKSEYDLSEFKLLDVYLSKINSRMPENRTVSFNKSELEEIYGVKRLKSKDLKESLLKLQQTAVSIYDAEVNTERNITLFELTELKYTSEGVSQIEMTCTPSAVKYFFNVEQLGYIKYRIGVITQISSIHSYLMFIYLEKFKHLKEWEVALSDLKKYLNCDNIESYKSYKEFNDKILKKVHRDLGSKGISKYQYEIIKTGRTVTGLRFRYERKPGELIDPVLCDQTVETSAIECSAEETDVIGRMLQICGDVFKKSDMQKIAECIAVSPLVQNIAADSADDKYVSYFRRIYSRYSEQLSNGTTIKSPVKYIIKMIENEAKEYMAPKEKENSGEYSGDDFDYDAFAITLSSNTKKKKEE